MIVSIPRPLPGTDENKRQVEFIEPIRDRGEVSVSRGYIFNLIAYNSGKECSYSPGFNYSFDFEHSEDATAFMLMFNGEIIPDEKTFSRY